MNTEQKNELKQRSYSVMMLYENIFQLKDPKIWKLLLLLMVFLTVPAILSYLFIEVDRSILFGVMFGTIYSSFPSRYNEQSYRRYLIKKLMKSV